MLSLGAGAQRVEFEFKGSDGKQLRYAIIGDLSKATSALLIWHKKRYGKPYEYEHVSIPEKVTYKGKEYKVGGIDGAFYNSEKLKTIDIPPTIGYISNDAFQGCYQLEKVNISDIEAWCKINFSANTPINQLCAHLYLNNELVTHITIPNTIDKIKSHTFDWCKSLESVIIPSSVKEIGNYAFQRCPKLKSVKIIGNNLNSIGENAFSSCSSLVELELPNSVKTIGEFAFSSCKSLSKISIPTAITTIPQYAFFHSQSLKTIVLPESVTSIKSKAFEGCEGLREVVIKNPAIQIEDYAFGSCTSLTKIKGLSERSRISAKAFMVDGYNGDYNKTPFSIEQYKRTFSYFATGKVEDAIAQWQKKSEFETAEEWKQRVTAANREKEVKNQP